MDAGREPEAELGLRITVRYWASARAAAGVDTDEIEVSGPLPLAEVLARVRAPHPEPRFAQVLASCALMVDDRPVTTSDPAAVLVGPGQSVEVLPPFAGG